MLQVYRVPDMTCTLVVVLLSFQIWNISEVLVSRLCQTWCSGNFSSTIFANITSTYFQFCLFRGCDVLELLRKFILLIFSRLHLVLGISWILQAWTLSSPSLAGLAFALRVHWGSQGKQVYHKYCFYSCSWQIFGSFLDSPKYVLCYTVFHCNILVLSNHLLVMYISIIW